MYYRKYRLIIPFLLPALILYSVFVLYPYARAFYISLTSWSGTAQTKPWVGFDNYKDLFQDERFRNAMLHNGKFLIFLPLFTITVSLLFATLFTQGGTGIKGAGFYRVVYFFPQVISVAIVGVLFQYVYNPRYGLLNTVLEKVGLESLQRTWLGSPTTIFWAVVFLFVWGAVGFYMVIYIASMQSIPTSFYEAATLDGAGRWRSFFDITLPLMWETIRTTLIYIAIGALDMFVLIQVLTSGGNNAATRQVETVAIYMYQKAFSFSEWGAASAIGVLLLLATLLLSVVIMRVTQRETYEF